MRWIVAVLLLWGLMTGPVSAALSDAEIRDYLKAKVAPEDQWRPQWSEVTRILNAQFPTGGPAAAGSALATRWKISPAAADAVVEAVTLSELRHVAGMDRRIAGLLTSALAEAPESPKVWAIRINRLSDH